MSSVVYHTMERKEQAMLPTLYLKSDVISVLKVTLALVPCEASQLLSSSGYDLGGTIGNLED